MQELLEAEAQDDSVRLREGANKSGQQPGASKQQQGSRQGAGQQQHTAAEKGAKKKRQKRMPAEAADGMV